MPARAAPLHYRFGRFELQPRERRLLAAGEAAVVGPRAFDLLVALVERAGHLVTKDELLALVWPNLVVEENNLQVHVSALRKILGPGAIATIAGQGYRFTLEPTRVEETSGPANHNLPHQLTSFIGRERELREVGKLLAASRLLTLVGVGGIGKTRLALRVAGEALDLYRDGVWFVDLARLADPGLVPSAVAQALNVHEHNGTALPDMLCAHVRSRQLLIILDNCEHVPEACALLASAMLTSAAELSIIATSREALEVGGEQLFPLPPMSLPDPGGSAEAIADSEAVQLFLARARLQKPDYALTSSSAVSVAALCAHLDGIPLALELAAARVGLFSVDEINARLDDRFKLLTRGNRAALPRQQTLRALFDWSYDLLTDRERAVFNRLAFFPGGFTLETASTVASDETIAPSEVALLVPQLAARSLVVADTGGSGTRYRMLETTRQYGRERLIERNEHDAIAVRHATTYAALAERLDRVYETTPDATWFAECETEQENWRAALSWSLAERHDVVLGQRLVAALRWAWSALAAAEGRRWVALASEAVDEKTPSQVLGALRLAEAVLAVALAQHTAALAAAEAAHAAFEALDEPRGLAEALVFSGRARAYTRDVEQGEALLRTGLAKAHSAGAHKLAAYATEYVAIARQFSGDLEEARRLYAEALAAYRASGADRRIPNAVGHLAELELDDGNPAAALRVAGEALPLLRARGDRRILAVVLGNMANYAIAMQNFDEARTYASEALTAARDAHYDAVILTSLQHLATIAALRSAADPPHARVDAARAARVLGFVDARFAHLEPREYHEQQEYEKALAAIYAALDGAQADALMREGALWTEDQATEQALQV